MVNRNLLRQYDSLECEIQQELDSLFDLGGTDWLPPEEQAFRQPGRDRPGAQGHSRRGLGGRRLQERRSHRSA